MPVLLVLIGMGRRDGGVHIAITRLSTGLLPDGKVDCYPTGGGKCFFAHKYPEMKYLAYFRAYTNTYAELEGLKRKYEEALQVDGVVGLVIGTRPDCMPEELLQYLEELNRHTFLMVEYGIESASDETLRRINRGHTYADTVEAVQRTAACGILTGGHVILGLPRETHDTMVEQAGILSALPLSTLKIHQLQLIRGTRMAHEYEENPEGFHLFTEVDEYIDLVIDYVEHLRRIWYWNVLFRSLPKNC